MSTPKHRVAMIGVGRMGTNHARGYELHPRCELVAAADPDRRNLDLFRERFGVSAVYESYEDLLANEEIDIAAPVLPVSVNPEVVIACAEAGVRAIFSEKPIAASLQEADRMVEVCRSRGIPFASGDSWRNLPQFRQFRSMVDSGEVGEVRSINVYHPHDEISGGGCQSLGVMRLMAGDADVDWVVGWVKGDPFDDGDQGMGGVVRFANGIEAFIHMNAVGKFGIEVNTSRAVFFSDWKSFRLWPLSDDATAVCPRLAGQRSPRCLRGRGRPRRPVRQGRSQAAPIPAALQHQRDCPCARGGRRALDERRRHAEGARNRHRP